MNDNTSTQAPSVDEHTANAQLRELLSRASDNQEKIDRIQSAELELLQSESLPELFNYLFNEHAMLFQLLSVNMMLIDPELRIHRILRETGDTTRFQRNLKLLDDKADIERVRELGHQPILAGYDPELHGWLLTDHGIDVGSIAILPLFRHNDLIGIVTCTSADIDRFQPSLGTDFLKRLGAILAISIENTVNYHHLQYLGLTDGLTGARNRRFLDQHLPEQVANAMHTARPLAFLFVDIDHFKHINDTYGHQCGDEVLQQVAKLVYNQLRNQDMLARYGGEEFAVILQNLNIEDAQRIAERIRANIEQTRIRAGEHRIAVTASIGVAEVSRLARTGDDIDALSALLTQAADSALYQAKNSGRNQVIVNDSRPTA